MQSIALRESLIKNRLEKQEDICYNYPDEEKLGNLSNND